MARNGKMISMTMSDGASIGVYHVEPQGERRGGLVLIQEIFGVTDHIKDQCNGYAAEGYEVLAPALFDREAPDFRAGYGREEIEAALRIARELHPFDLSVEDARVCIDALRDKGPAFIVGYCYGGSVAWAAACRCDGLAAASCYYGSKIPELAGETPTCPTILHFGRYDKRIPLKRVKEVMRLHPGLDVYIYDAGHGFNSDRRAEYRRESAELARMRALALFGASRA